MSVEDPKAGTAVISRTSILQRIRVPLGFAFAAVYAFFSEPSLGFVWSGTVVAAFGLALRIWACGHLRKHQELSVGGPYRWTRNPLYLGSFLMGGGFTVAAAKPWILILFLLLFFGIYVPVMRKEEQELGAAYGRLFEQYRKRVPLFIPRLTPDPTPLARNFSLKQVILNREYKAVLGFLIVFVFLLVRSS